jgi:phage head maturation protease
VRYITHIDHLFDVTLAATPAYPQTTAEAREMPISVRELLAGDEEEDKEAAEREKQEKIKANETAIAEVRKAAEYKVEYQF